jgi:aryl-alcohol dehydrogenase-like predicted oxidoreductase
LAVVMPEFGLGLVSLGRTWGYRPSSLPTREQAHTLLEKAVELGVTVFDTAPAYGQSEHLTGEFFRQLPLASRNRLVLSTKCGEHWDSVKHASFVDHSFHALVRSIDRSMELLGRIDLLQIHKATVEVLRTSGVWKALDHARLRGIQAIGASVTDLETGGLACSLDAIDVIQFPFSARFCALEDLLFEAAEHGKQVWTNRPFAMGEMIHEGGISPVDAYSFIVPRKFHGAVLTGTSNVHHLVDDVHAFREALRKLGTPTLSPTDSELE